MQTKLIDIDVETASSSSFKYQINTNDSTKPLHMKIDASMLKIPTFKIVNNSKNSDTVSHKISMKQVNSSPTKSGTSDLIVSSCIDQIADETLKLKDKCQNVTNEIRTDNIEIM